MQINDLNKKTKKLFPEITISHLGDLNLNLETKKEIAKAFTFLGKEEGGPIGTKNTIIYHKKNQKAFEFIQKKLKKHYKDKEEIFLGKPTDDIKKLNIIRLNISKQPK